MPRFTFLGVLLVAATAACTTEPTSTLVRHGGDGLAAKGGGSTRTVTASQDIAPITRPDGTPVRLSVNATRPFKNLDLANVTVTLSAPTGDPAACKAAGTTNNRTYSDSFGDNAGTWTGGMSVWQGSTPAASNFKFSGSRTNPQTGASEWIQFTANDNDALEVTSGSTVTLQISSAPLGFGSNSTHWDLDAAGLPVMRCVRLTLVAAP